MLKICILVTHTICIMFGFILQTSPADGRVLHFGKVEDGIVEQVKGVNYTIQGFLGPQPGDEERTKPLPETEYQEKMKIKPGYDLYNCIIYLAPGDYHRFHSPSDWKISHRRHFPGMYQD